MKKVIVLLALIAFAVSLVFIPNDMAFAAEKKKKAKEETKAEPKEESKVETKKAEEPKVMCKFKNKDEMTAFEQLYVAKQATFGRMGVLQAYFLMEQNNLQSIDKQMEEKFKLKMDPNKMYDLNRDTMEIREIGPVSQAAPAER